MSMSTAVPRTKRRVRILGVKQIAPRACPVILSLLGGLALVVGWLLLDLLRWALPKILAILACL